MTLMDEDLELLDEEACLALLGSTSIGRVAVTLGALPAVLPVNFGLLDGDIVFWTGEGTKLRAAVANAVVGFEADRIDPVDRTGWSVLVVGRAVEVKDPGTIERARALGIRPWTAANRRSHAILIHPEFVSGRRIRTDTDDDAADGLPVVE
jgi:uncharacterized protein